MIRGKVFVRRPGQRRFVELTDDSLIRVGSLVDTRRGTIRLTSALPNGTTQSGDFSTGHLPSPPVGQEEREGAHRAALGGRELPRLRRAPPGVVEAGSAGLREEDPEPDEATPRAATEHADATARPRSGERSGSRSTAATARSRRSPAGASRYATSASSAPSSCARAAATWPGRASRLTDPGGWGRVGICHAGRRHCSV